MAAKFFVAFIALGIPLLAQCYSSGAPGEECSTMTPRHHVDPQTGPSPYDIILDKRSIRAGETVTITIKGRNNDDTIKGLLVQARVGDTPVGKFDVSPSRQYVQTLDCGSSRGVSISTGAQIIMNAVTHKKLAQGVQQVTFKWTAPANLSERVVFLATVAKNGGVFWVQQKSDILNVK